MWWQTGSFYWTQSSRVRSYWVSCGVSFREKGRSVNIEFVERLIYIYIYFIYLLFFPGGWVGVGLDTSDLCWAVGCVCCRSWLHNRSEWRWGVYPHRAAGKASFPLVPPTFSPVFWPSHPLMPGLSWRGSHSFPVPTLWPLPFTPWPRPSPLVVLVRGFGSLLVWVLVQAFSDEVSVCLYFLYFF